MFFKYRPARLEDLEECQHFSRDHFAYTEQERQHLGLLWRELVTGGAGNFAVIEDSMAPVGQRIVWHCFAVFVPDDCVHSLTTAGLPLIGRQILTQWKRKESPLLSFAQVRQANSHGGVNMLILNSGAPSRVQTEEHWPSVSNKIVDFSIYHSSGYRLKQFLVELYSPFTWAWVEGGGLRLRNDYAAYYKRDGIALPPTDQRPRLYGLNAQEAQECPGMVMSPMFHFEPPCFYFSPAEQELLRNALSGETDEELAKILHMAVVSVKKRWTNIYERVEAITPELFPASRAATKESKRGVEKKRTLLYYLRHHLEELRPVELPKTF